VDSPRETLTIGVSEIQIVWFFFQITPFKYRGIRCQPYVLHGTEDIFRGLDTPTTSPKGNALIVGGMGFEHGLKITLALIQQAPQ
jgi:hypothetical protein